ncbi:MAG TPA: hemolysin family protein [Candidatus Adamsella sp.]|nr:hemolysin family protein [Candidatus Adamsella sp.]
MSIDISLILNLFIITFLLLLNAFFVAAEFALVGVRKTRILQLSNEGNFDAKLALDAIKNIDRYIAAVQLGITISSLGIGWVGESTIARLIHPLFSFLPDSFESLTTHTVAITVAFALITVLHVVIGELMPKSIALQFPEGTTLFVAKPMYVVTRLFAPMIFLLNGLGNILLRMCGIEPASGHHLVHSTEELNMLIDASYKGGVLNEKETEMLQNVFKFSDLTAEQIMIPRPDMVCIPLDISQENLSKILIENQYTRYPVYGSDLDHIVGFLHIKDIYPIIAEHKKIELSSILREAFFIPETMTIDNLAVEFQKRRFQMAIVVDEFGGTSGLVTLEDVLEEIFGEVQDEFDEEEKDVKQTGENVYEICGKMRTDEFNEYFNVSLDDDEDVKTIGGYFVKKLGRIAKENDEISDEFFTYRVVKTDSARVLKLRIERLIKAENPVAE